MSTSNIQTAEKHENFISAQSELTADTLAQIINSEPAFAGRPVRFAASTIDGDVSVMDTTVVGVAADHEGNLTIILFDGSVEDWKNR